MTPEHCNDPAAAGLLSSVEIAVPEAQVLVSKIFSAVGGPPEEAAIVAADLIDADLAGLASHGLMRVPEYVAAVRSGDAVPGAPMTIVKDLPATALVDGGRNLGQVVGRRALDLAITKAHAAGAAVVVVRNTHHVGRLGAFAERAAAAAMICVACVTVRPRGHFVVPWGGREPRIGTNPFAYGIPTNDAPVISDFATSVVPEGVVRRALAEGREVPRDAIVDALGRPTRAAADFYGPPRGALLPLGAEVGYKGYALGLMAEFLAGTLAGALPQDDDRSANGMWLCVVDPAAFGSVAAFRSTASDLVDYVTSSTPIDRDRPVMAPGEPERRRRLTAGGRLRIDDRTWASILDTARALGVSGTDASVHLDAEPGP